MLPQLPVPPCVPHSLSSLSEAPEQFLFPFFLPQAKHTEGGLRPQGIPLLRSFQREQMAMAHEHFRHHYRCGWAHLKETEKPICPAIQTMSLSLADTAQPHRCTRPRRRIQLPASRGRGAGRIRAPPCYYGNTAAVLGTTLVTAAILFSNGPTQSCLGKSSSQREECKQPSLSRGGSSPRCPQPPRQPPQPFIKCRAIPFACRSVLFPLPFSRERFRIHLPV